MSTKTDTPREPGPERPTRAAISARPGPSSRPRPGGRQPPLAGPARLGALVLAAADLDAGRAAAALPAVARRDPRLADPADQRRPGQGRAVQGRAHHPRRIYDKLGLFHVYSSVWFSAIYILLFISLIGCIVPRSWQFVGQLRGRPPAAPRRLTRLPAYTTWRTRRGARGGARGGPAAAEEAALPRPPGRRRRRRREGLSARGRQPRLPRRADRDAGGVRRRQLWKSEGSKLITEGDGFSNSLTQYDDFKSGAVLRHRRPGALRLHARHASTRPTSGAARRRAPRAPSAPTSPTSRARTARSTRPPSR